MAYNRQKVKVNPSTKFDHFWSGSKEDYESYEKSEKP